MARSKGSANLAASLEVLAGAPLDAREVVQTKADLTAQDSFPYKYIGLEVYVVAENKKYRLLGNDPTNIENWQEVKEGGGSGTDYADLDNKPQVEGVTLVGNKSASDLGLAKSSDLTNFITKSVDDLVNYYLKTETYSKTEVDTIVTAIKNSRFEVVSSLPTTNIKTNVIYLVPSSDPQTSDVKDEYINLDGTTAGWEKIGSTTVDLSGYVTTSDLNTALADYTTTTDLTALLVAKQDKIQVSTMPTASADYLGKILQFMGATTSTYTHGYFYECKENSGTYSWVQVNVQPSNGAGGGHTIEDAEGTALTQRDTMQFSDGLSASDDSTNEKTVVTLDPMPAEDIDEVVDIYPARGNLVSIVNAFNKGDLYSTEERMIGQWIDGKPLYQKVCKKTFGTVGTSQIALSFADLLPNHEYVMPVFGKCHGCTISQSFSSGDAYIRFDSIVVYAQNSWFSNQECLVVYRYTKTTDSAISIGEATEYSTEEKIVGTWIDGKPIYQKTIDCGALPNATSKQIAHGISNIDKFISIQGVSLSSTENFAMPMVYRNSDATYNTSLSANGTYIILRNSQDRSMFSCYVTLQYTKTTGT